jgi:tRNA-2-methylthio-N6-dimethylallyladenosine synthase
MAERAGAELIKKYPHIDLMAGPSQLDQVPVLLESHFMEAHQSSYDKVALSGFRKREKGQEKDRLIEIEALDQTRAGEINLSKQSFVRITRGCNKFCSFCVVPMTRGPEVHRPAQSIVDECKRLVDSGAKEITLLGQTINHYSATENGKQTSFAELLYQIHEATPDLPRLRFLTSYPRDFTEEALDVMASCERICNYLHIPAQSGSDVVLKKMNRGYTKDIYLELIDKARSKMPDISIVGDMIVGFPNETEEDFVMSLDMLKEVKYKNIFVFKYSPRPGTVSGKRDADPIAQKEKKERNARMLAVQQEISLAHHQHMLGTTYDVLVEGIAKIDPNQQARMQAQAAPNDLLQIGGGGLPSSISTFTEDVRLTARTRGDHIVAFDGSADLIGQIVPVKVSEAASLSLKGTLAL